MSDAVPILLADFYHPRNQNRTFPYAAGCVGAHAAAVLGERISVEVCRTPEDLGAAVARRPPALVGFTNYLWNLELGYEVIRQLRAFSPETVVVMGGPNYPVETDGQRAFLRRHTLVDFYVYKEGEIPFVQLLEALLERDFDAAALRRERPAVPALHYLDGGELVAPPPLPRQRNLDAFASPYLSGLLDPFFARRDLVPLIQTKRGCPFQCTFCVEGEDYYAKLGTTSTERLRAELEYIAARMRGGAPLLHIADSNFGMYEQDLEICDIVADVRERFGWPETIEVSTGKNKKERVLEAVRRTQGAMRFGPALQSTDPRTLRNIKRSNISETVLMDMARAAGEMGQRSYTELILGLPGDTATSHLASIRAAVDAEIQRVKMYPLVLLPGTELSSEATRREFALETRFRVLPQCHGTYRFTGPSFPAVEIDEVVIATSTMSFAEYLRCKRFQLSVEIFYNDLYLEELHGLVRALGVSMFDVVERCHDGVSGSAPELRALYDAIEEGVRASLWSSRDECLDSYRDPANLEEFTLREYKNSIASLKALALLEHIEPVLEVARRGVTSALAGAGIDDPLLRDYLDQLIEYSRLRRHRILDASIRPEGSFRFDFDRIREQRFRVRPEAFRLPGPRRMRFWHDRRQADGIRSLREEIRDPVLLARSFIYPRTDPGQNPYLRHASFDRAPTARP